MNLSHTVAKIWEKLSTSVWFIPAFMCLASIFLAAVMLQLDHGFANVPWRWLSYFQIGADGMRQIFVVTTSSMMTVTGVTFSITIVALTLASNQFGPKILRNYLKDTPNKVVLGLLLSTFIYGLVILVFIDGSKEGYVPLFATLVNLLMTGCAIAGVIYFINSITSSIQAENVIALIAEDLDQSITAMDSSPNRNDDNSLEQWNKITQQNKQVIKSTNDGYVQYIDHQTLLETATELDGYFKIMVQTGEFLINDLEVIHYYASKKLEPSVADKIASCIGTGQRRIPAQDIEFSIEQLVQVALRALSPGINDSYTAMNCIDWLSGKLGKMSDKHFRPAWICDDRELPRIRMITNSFGGAVRAAYNPLRQNARNNVMVVIRLLESLASIMKVTTDQQRLEALAEQARAIHESALEDIDRSMDLKAIQERYQICEYLVSSKH